MNKMDQERAVLRRMKQGGAAAQEGDVGPLIRRGTLIILVMLWVFGALLAAGSGWLLLYHARAHTAATAISLEQFAGRTMTMAEFAVDEYEEFLDQRGSTSGISEDPANREKLDTLVHWLPEGSTIGMVSPEGRLLTSTTPVATPPPLATDRRWYKAIAREGLESYVGPAIRSRVNNRYVFTYSARYPATGGPLAAIINLGIPSNSVTGLALDQHHTNMALVQHEGFLVAAQPFSPGMTDGPFVFPASLSGGDATGYGTAFGAWSVVSVHDLPDLKLYAFAAVPVREVLQPLFWGIGLGLPVLLLLTRLLLALSNQLQAKSQQVEQALADNKVLFQEVHHRVKNNLQVVSSLLRLQTERVPPELRPLLDETGARVRAIALVHEQIYRTASPSEVQLDRFLAQLVQQLSASLIGDMARIATDLQPVTIGLDRAVPVAILATEAITNAIKHGLDDGQGTIAVRLATRDGRILLTVEDSGAGMPEDGKVGLGTRIMTALSRQIDGDWSLDAGAAGGTRFTLSWPV